MANRKKVPKTDYCKNKMHKVMKKYKNHSLHTGGKNGPIVTSRPQAVAIGISYCKKGPPRARKIKKLRKYFF